LELLAAEPVENLVMKIERVDLLIAEYLGAATAQFKAFFRKNECDKP
jgi:hypothetical protein